MYLILHFAALLFPYLGLMSFVLWTNVASFLFYMIIFSDVAFVLTIKKLWDLEWWFGGTVLFNLSFILSDTEGPGTTSELFGRLFALSRLRIVSVGLLRL